VAFKLAPSQMRGPPFGTGCNVNRSICANWLRGGRRCLTSDDERDCPWHRRTRNAVGYSLGIWLVLVYMALVVTVAVTFMGGVQKVVSAGWREAARPLWMDCVEPLPETAEVPGQRQAPMRDLAEMSGLINDLLESERLARRHAALHRQPTNVAVLEREVIDDFGTRLVALAHGGSLEIANARPGLQVTARSPVSS